MLSLKRYGRLCVEDTGLVSSLASAGCSSYTSVSDSDQENCSIANLCGKCR